MTRICKLIPVKVSASMEFILSTAEGLKISLSNHERDCPRWTAVVVLASMQDGVAQRTGDKWPTVQSNQVRP